MAEDRETRRFPRFSIRGVQGGVTIPREAEVLDLGLRGALLEHQGMLHVGAPCLVYLPIAGEALTIQCRVAHSRVSRREPEGALYYQTGVEFLDLTPAAEQALGALIRSFGAPKE